MAEVMSTFTSVSVRSHQQGFTTDKRNSSNCNCRKPQLYLVKLNRVDVKKRILQITIPCWYSGIMIARRTFTCCSSLFSIISRATLQIRRMLRAGSCSSLEVARGGKRNQKITIPCWTLVFLTLAKVMSTFTSVSVKSHQQGYTTDKENSSDCKIPQDHNTLLVFLTLAQVMLNFTSVSVKVTSPGLHYRQKELQ